VDDPFYLGERTLTEDVKSNQADALSTLAPGMTGPAARIGDGGLNCGSS